jgi:hypothetical protein
MKRAIDWIKSHRKQSILIALAVVIILGGGGYFGYTKFKQGRTNRTDTKSNTKTTEAVKPLTKPSPLTGVEVAPDLADRPVRAVVIENHPDARPQSGLGEAGIVYEALAEGGITRFLSFFLDSRPGQLGPVRSLRPYFADWTLEFGAPIAHVGGNQIALGMIRTDGVRSLNEFAFGGSYYRARDRYAPHNAYTTTESLDNLLVTLGYDKPATFKPNARKKDLPPTASAPATHPVIGINYSYPDFQVEYRYDPINNDYLRFLAGAPHIDRNTGQQIRVKNVVVEYMAITYGYTPIGEQALFMSTPGTGSAIVFRDGGAITGTWGKSTHEERTKLTDGNGAEIPLNAGNTWFAIVPNDRPVSY